MADSIITNQEIVNSLTELVTTTEFIESAVQGPPGPPGPAVPGPQGPAGPEGPEYQGEDLPDFTLLFENKLV